VKAKVVENKKEDFAEMMKGLGQLVTQYAHLPADKMQAFAQTATTGPGDGAMQGTARIQGLNVLLKDDSMTVWVDPASLMMRRVEIKTIYDKKPASLATDYRAVSNGPTYMARAVLTYPEKNVELTVDNYEHERPRHSQVKALSFLDPASESDFSSFTQALPDPQRTWRAASGSRPADPGPQ
jgi:hypothetical protein